MNKLALDDLARAVESEAVGENVDQFCSHSLWRNAARAILTTIKEAGYAIVPVEADDMMVKAGSAVAFENPTYADDIATVWKAMQSAAPTIEGE